MEGTSARTVDIYSEREAALVLKLDDVGSQAVNQRLVDRSLNEDCSGRIGSIVPIRLAQTRTASSVVSPPGCHRSLRKIPRLHHGGCQRRNASWARICGTPAAAHRPTRHQQPIHTWFRTRSTSVTSALPAPILLLLPSLSTPSPKIPPPKKLTFPPPHTTPEYKRTTLVSQAP